MILCLRRVQWRSTRSVWMKVENMWASAPRMGRWDLSVYHCWLLILGPAAKNHQSAFIIFHNSSSDSCKTHLITAKLYANDVELEVFGSEFLEGTSFTVRALTWSFISTISTHKPIFFFTMQEFIKSSYQFWRVGKRIALRSVELSVRHQPSMDTLSMFSTLLLSCLLSSLPPSFMDFEVKICSLISPPTHF